jgi:hypothetical protein
LEGYFFEDYDPNLAESLRSQFEDKINVQDIGLFFDFDNHPKIEKGENIPIANENREEYANLIIDYIFNKSIQL